MTGKPEWRLIRHERQNPIGEHIAITAQGITFSAAFIKGNRLMNKEAVGIYDDKFDAMKLGFKFFDKKKDSTYKLIKCSTSSNAGTRQANIKSLINQRPILKKIQNAKQRPSRTFKPELFGEDMFFIKLIPSFELRADSHSLNNIDPKAIGIYRCHDQSGAIIYIGSGVIRDRVNYRQAETNNAIAFVEYSILQDKDDAIYWETFHLDRYEKEHGRLPLFNKVRGRRIENIIGGNKDDMD
ncbi:hypothetical protein N9V72_03370 [Pseudomonadota bacterium]|nr:hypothetical protein [Pseudomonadota bacterium]